jgi:DNA-directed RNA polymerase sigma subunit (sigma70/sigma32)
MGKGDRNRRVRSALRRHIRSLRRVQDSRRNLIDELRAAKTEDNYTLQELGNLIGVSRQRIHQLLNENE